MFNNSDSKKTNLKNLVNRFRSLYDSLKDHFSEKPDIDVVS